MNLEVTYDMNSIKKIHSRNLKPGMILADDIFVNDIKMLNHGIEITPSIVIKLQEQFPLGFIAIYHENIKFSNKKNSEQFKKSQENFLAFTNAAENLFAKTMESDTVNMKSVRDLCDNVIDEVRDTSTVIKSILEGHQIDTYLFRHSVNVSALCALTGKWLNLSQNDIMLLSYSGMLHDIGKCRIPPKILNKPGAFTKVERNICNTHTKYSYEIVKKIPFLDSKVAIATLLHHEKADGSGYPLGLKGDKIPLFAKIVAIADVFDAMTSDRVYRQKDCPLHVLSQIKDEIFGKLDPYIASIFVENILTYYIGDTARLNNGKQGKIIKLDINNITRPWLEVDGNLVDLSKEKDLKIEDIL